MRVGFRALRAFAGARTTLVGALAAAMGATALVATAPSAQAAISIDANASYVIVNAHSGKALDLYGWSTADGAEFRQWTRSDAVNQQFQLVSSGDGYYRLKNRHSSKVLDIWGWSTQDGAEVNQYADLNGANQQFKLAGTSNSAVRFINRNSGKALEVWEWSTADGGDISQFTDTGAANQTWSLVAVGSGSTPTTTTTTRPTTTTTRPTTTTSSSAKPTVAKDGTGSYTSVQAAINAVPSNNTSRRVITIKPGTYREIVTIPSNKPYITLQGLGSSASQTLLVYNNYAANTGTFNSASAFISGHDFTATNLTFSNDFDEGSHDGTSGEQAVALNLSADRATFSNVRFLGDQDTLLVNSGARSYFVNSYIEGTVDFIFGDGTAVFNASSIYEKRSSGGPITAARTPSSNTYGFLFYKSTITGATNNTTQLGRPWGASAQVVYRESNLSATIATSQPWIDMSSNSWKNARFSEYKNYGSGATTNSNRKQLSDSQAANYTPQKYLAGSDGWNPL